ncbi:hypothetical protein SMACR_00909 [Sordaria macrospora]|uniref:WGS project CABT00000000 data, contig 2.2 n=2 Tax=Sordaria macrospora TaxID=5147 RepID=F7VNF4_SORMK|nr:uncharacterized protein SMAC_00909 [Sordaria macrospora k-hell]KAA8630947.1 hypothetical protein SMACR_00909 [Sordaria macrospora]KAH7630734.1 hypothetical protein B0T09DRAFT_382650 [Sordaria sp. MPI-SDFR-AT-0083]WPJ62151.1 hypothetical protein SMAC4_00909 [Sordaria macrospora]CCC06883.1 unnamed protein product [Sordaria macrospora k-hell]
MSTNLSTGAVLHDVERTAGKKEHGQHADHRAQTTTTTTTTTTTGTRVFSSSSWRRFLQQSQEAKVNNMNISLKENPKWYQKLLDAGVEENGIQPVPIEGRTSTHLYLVIIPLLLNAATVTGFSLMSAIAGGQTLAALNPSHVSVNVGIIITCLVAFGVSLLGFNFVHFWQR